MFYYFHMSCGEKILFSVDYFNHVKLQRNRTTAESLHVSFKQATSSLNSSKLLQTNPKTLILIIQSGSVLITCTRTLFSCGRARELQRWSRAPSFTAGLGGSRSVSLSEEKSSLKQPFKLALVHCVVEFVRCQSLGRVSVDLNRELPPKVTRAVLRVYVSFQSAVSSFH